jgi:hypothetical protein
MATVVTRYVNLNSTAGGDGTTNATVGANRAYSSLNAWEAARNRDLVAADEIELVYCTGGSGLSDTAALAILGWTTDATRYIQIEGNPSDSGGKHEGKYDTAKYIKGGIASGNTVGITISENYVRIKNIQLNSTQSSGSGTRQGVDISSIDSGGSDIRIESIIYVQNDQGRSNTCIRLNDSDASVSVNNSVFFRLPTALVNSQGVSITLGTLIGYNNTFIGTASGYGSAAGTSTLKNNIFQNCGTDIVTGGTIICDYNLTTSASNPGGAGTNNQLSKTLTFKDAANYDYHLKSTDTSARDNGIGPSSDANVPTTDIDGGTRSGTTCDIGADEYQSPSVSVSFSVSSASISSFSGVVLNTAGSNMSVRSSISM